MCLHTLSFTWVLGSERRSSCSTLFATETLRWALGPVQDTPYETPGLRAGPSRAEQHTVSRGSELCGEGSRTVCGACGRVGVGILLSLGLHSSHRCDKMTDKGGKGLPWLTPQEHTVHHGGKA